MIESDLQSNWKHLPGIVGGANANDEIVIMRDGKPHKASFAEYMGYYKLIGFFDYNDAETSTTPISVSADTWTKLTNDGAGAYTRKEFAPNGITDVWDTTNDQFDFSMLSHGDIVDIRIDIEITTNSNYQEVEIAVKAGTGLGEYRVKWLPAAVYKNSGIYNISCINSLYIGDNNTQDNPAELQILTDDLATVKVNGWYIKILGRIQ